jgi:hypothetical protein
MAKTNWQDPGSSEVRSTHISGLQDAVGKIEDVLDLKLQAETAVPLTEVYISELDRYRIYQAPAGKRNWASTPSPVIKKNGVVISSGFTIDYGGGAIIASPAATSTDTFTADVSYTKTGDNALDEHKEDYATLLAGGTVYTITTFENGWSGTLKYKKNGLGIVNLWGELTIGRAIGGDGVATLPVGFRPLEHTVIPIYGSSGTNVRKGIISLGLNKDNGEIFVLTDSKLVQGETLRISYIFQA